MTKHNYKSITHCETCWDKGIAKANNRDKVIALMGQPIFIGSPKEVSFLKKNIDKYLPVFKRSTK